MAEDAQIVIIGSGVAGSVAAKHYLALGVTSIVMLEAGPPILMADYRTWLDEVMAGVLPYHELYDTMSDFSSSGANPWEIVGSRLFGRGGSTIHWGGWAPRFMPEDFQLKTNTGKGIDWLYSYADLEPYYVQAERYLQVSGKFFTGQRDWRSAPFPLAAATMPLTAQPIIKSLNFTGISHQHMPTARNTVAINGRAQCVTTGTCHYCPFGARFTGDQPLDDLASNPAFKLITDAPVQRILTSSKARASGVQYLDTTSGVSKTINASVAVIVCAGAFETPKLLLASANNFWPNGIGNDYDLVGRYLSANPYIYARAAGPRNPFRVQQELNFPSLCSRYWDSPAEQAKGKFLMNMSYGAPLIKPAYLMYQGQSAAAIKALTTGEVNYELQGALAPFPFYENRVTLDSGKTRFGLPRTKITTPYLLVPPSTINTNVARMNAIFKGMGFEPTEPGGTYPQRGDHAGSTCRMAATPDLGVVDGSLLVHGMSNLMIASNAVMPTIGAANLTLTLVALLMLVLQRNALSIK